MKFQLMAEDASASLDELSASALARVPRAGREGARLRDEASELRKRCGSLNARLEAAAARSEACVARLAAVGAVRARMEEARGTLHEAAGLSELLVNIDAVLASGDATRAAATLAQMRRCIDAVTDVPQFQDARQRLAAHEDRLQEMVAPQLEEAIRAKDAEATKAARAVLESIGRGKFVLDMYVKGRLAPVLAAWQSFSAGGAQSFCEWLPAFSEALLAAVDEDALWAETAMPGLRSALTPRVVCEAMEAVATQFVARVSKAADTAAAAGRPPVEELVALRGRAHALAEALLPRLAGCSAAAIDEVLRAVDSPYVGALEGYAPAEREQLEAEMRQASAVGAVAGALAGGAVGFGEAVAVLESSANEMAAALERSLRRCLAVAGMSESVDCVKVCDAAGAAFVSSMAEQLSALRAACAPFGVAQVRTKGKKGTAPGGAAPADEATFEALVQGALALLSAASAVASRLAATDAAARAQLRRGAAALAAADAAAVSDGGAPPYAGADVGAVLARLRLRAPGRAEHRAALEELLVALEADAPAEPVLPCMSARAAAFDKAADVLVYDVLSSRVRRHLEDYAHLPVWDAPAEPSGGAGFEMPTFSAYPQACVTAVGEYLLMLPQQFEPLLGAGPSSPVGAPASSGGDVDDTRLASEWVARVAGGAAATATEAALAIEVANDAGAAQLAADLEYLSNVVAALGVAVPPAMRTLLQGATASASEVRSACDGGDARAAEAVLKMRRRALEKAEAAEKGAASQA